MNCIIVDDEELAHHIVLEYASRIPFLNVVKTCYDIQDALVALQEEQVDLIFLDINLPNISGMEFLKSSTRLPHVIITTAYDNCALEGFEMDVIDYLLKPFSFERFLKAVYKSYNLYNHKNAIEQTNNSKLKETFLFVRANSEEIKLNFNEIVRINALKDYIIIYTTTQKFIVHQTMKSFMEKINFDDFIRIHNSHIVSLHHLQSVGKNSVLIGDERIPISEKYKPYLNTIIERFK